MAEIENDDTIIEEENEVIALPLEPEKPACFCYECEEAKRHVRKIRYHWLTNLTLNLATLSPTLLFLIAGIFSLIMALVNPNNRGFLYSTILLMLASFPLGLKFYREIFMGFSLYRFKTADGILHSHLKKPAIDTIKNLPLLVVVKTGVCGWFRKSKILSVGPYARGLTFCWSHSGLYNGLKIDKACCSRRTLELQVITLKDEEGDCITFLDIKKLFDYLEGERLTLNNPRRIRNLFTEVETLRGLVDGFVKDQDKHKTELQTARAETEKYKEIVKMYMHYEQSLIDWITQSRENPNLGKSKHAQAIKQKLLEHQRAVEERYEEDGEISTLRRKGLAAGNIDH